MKSALVLQPFGLGDCIFAQGIAHYFINGGYKVYWPVIQDYLTDLKRAYPKIEWLPENLYVSPTNDKIVDLNIKYELLHAISVPIRWSNTFHGVEYAQVMRAKYDMYGLDWTKWTQHAMWERNFFKEKELVADNVGEYNLVSMDWGSPGGKQNTVKVKYPDNGLHTRRMVKINGCSLFDWATVIENATTIHFVASANIFILEMLDLKAKEIHLYPRLPDQPHHNFYKYILKRHNYIFH